VTLGAALSETLSTFAAYEETLVSCTVRMMWCSDDDVELRWWRGITRCGGTCDASRLNTKRDP
jgi:hypothetical protein